MSAPSSITEYLVEFNLCLQVGIDRRIRILAEVEDHLRDAAAEMGAKGASQGEAEVAAIAAFGPPDTVARSFGTDVVAAMEARLSRAGAALDTWMAEHPWAGAAVYVAPAAALVAIATFFAALAGVHAPLFGLAALSILIWLYFLRALRARAVQGRPEPGVRARLAAGNAELPRWLRWHCPPTLWAGTEPGGGLGCAGALASMTYQQMSDPMTEGGRGPLGPLGRLAVGLVAALLLLMAAHGTQDLRRRWRHSRGRRHFAGLAPRHPWRHGALATLFILAELAWIVGPDSAVPLSFRLCLVVSVLVVFAISGVSSGFGEARKERRAIQRHLAAGARFADDIATLAQQVEDHTKKADRGGEAAALARLGHAYDEQGRLDEAVACAEDSLDAYRAVGDRQGEAQALIALGRFWERRRRQRLTFPGGGHKAMSWFQEAASIYRALGDGGGEAGAVLCLASAHAERRHWDQALTCAQESLKAYRALGDHGGEAKALSVLGDICSGRDHSDQAIYYQASVEMHRRIGNRHGEAEMLVSLATAYKKQRRWEQVMAVGRQGRDCYRDLGDGGGEAAALALLGEAHGGLGKGGLAKQHWRQALVLLERSGDPKAEDVRFWLGFGRSPVGEG